MTVTFPFWTHLVTLYATSRFSRRTNASTRCWHPSPVPARPPYLCTSPYSFESSLRPQISPGSGHSPLHYYTVDIDETIHQESRASTLNIPDPLGSGPYCAVCTARKSVVFQPSSMSQKGSRVSLRSESHHNKLYRDDLKT